MGCEQGMYIYGNLCDFEGLLEYTKDQHVVTLLYAQESAWAAAAEQVTASHTANCCQLQRGTKTRHNRRSSYISEAAMPPAAAVAAKTSTHHTH
jgi:hypothetical protein